LWVVASIFGSQKWANRLGFRHNKNNNVIDIWLHASSMGEITVLKIITDEISRQKENLTFYITVMTDTGYKKACEIFGPDSVGFLPLDYRSSINRFYQRVRPGKGVIIETEIWPNLILGLFKKNIAFYLANGRLTEKSVGLYIKFKPVLDRVLKCYRRIMVQTEADCKRFIKIGAPASIVETVGSLKFDAPLTIINQEEKNRLVGMLPFIPSGKTFIAGSIRNDEWSILIDTYAKLRESDSGIKMIFVPRYLDKMDELVKIIENRDISCQRLSLIEKESKSKREADILIVDKMGVLIDYYAISDIAFVGGTFDNMGGHNILEPVWAGIPVLYGPSIFSVDESAEYITNGNYGEMVRNEKELVNKLLDFFDNKVVYSRKQPDSQENYRVRKTAETILQDLP
jgi:tRNA (guanine-N7-)-methyltransferase